MHRFYTPQLTPETRRLDISTPGEIHHIRDVLRLRSGDVLELINGKGSLARGCIKNISSVAVQVDITEVREEAPRLPHLILACAIPKKGKFETIIEKTTELGVDEIIPLQTHNSDVIIKPEKAAHKQTRYIQVAVNAAKQCQRSTVPAIHPPMPFNEALSRLLSQSVVIMPSLTGLTEPLFPALRKLSTPSHLSIMIGPEGDFSKNEYAQAQSSGVIAVTLGPTVLKVETAAMTTVAVTRLFFDTTDD
ncbi:MAG: 16S rRNA (uracil(1498)-N(3))-methyltransferase [Candidatus Omnitrophica bacterium]|nr:16S rRNA (uracil(1498)-N(3))-methyltransferase [Candidatus Omnitrophota bacterium]